MKLQGVPNTKTRMSEMLNKRNDPYNLFCSKETLFWWSPHANKHYALWDKISELYNRTKISVGNVCLNIINNPIECDILLAI